MNLIEISSGRTVRCRVLRSPYLLPYFSTGIGQHYRLLVESRFSLKAAQLTPEIWKESCRMASARTTHRLDTGLEVKRFTSITDLNEPEDLELISRT
jgi:hypothetical protein